MAESKKAHQMSLTRHFTIYCDGEVFDSFLGHEVDCEETTGGHKSEQELLDPKCAKTKLPEADTEPHLEQPLSRDKA